MDVEEFPPPPPEMLDVGPPFTDEDEGEQFEFDDSGDEVPEADRPAPAPPTPDYASTAPVAGANEQLPKKAVKDNDLLPPLEGTTASSANISLKEGDGFSKDIAPPPVAPAPGPQGKVNPYSVIDIAPLQQRPSPPSLETEAVSPSDAPPSPRVPPGYAVPPHRDYAVPSNVPAITPAYTTPVIIRHLSADEDVTVVGTGNISSDSVFSEEYPAIQEEDALSKWVSDPANTAWMESPDEVIYDDVPRENSDSTPDEMIYDDVERGEEGSSLDNGWSSSEFESYDEQSDCESRGENGLPDAFLRSGPSRSKTHVCSRFTLSSGKCFGPKQKPLPATSVARTVTDKKGL